MIRASAFAIALSFVAGSVSAGVYTDGTFAGWTSSSTPGGAGSVSNTLGLSLPCLVSETSTTIFQTAPSVTWMSDFTYNPADGPLSITNMRVDANNFESQSGNGQLFGFALKQNGIVYQTIATYFAMPFSDWNTTNSGALSSSNFGQVDALFNHPDFSSAGAPITFGLISYAIYDPNFNSEYNKVLYDNYRVDFVPAPGLAGLLALGGLAVGRRRR
jgi:MYXO-CTERM domain-containing protein